MGYKFNPISGNFDLTGTSGGGGGGAATWKTAVANAAALPLLGNSDGDVRVTLDNHHLWVWDASGPAWLDLGSASDTFFSEIIQLNGTDVSNQFVTLSFTPLDPSAVILDIISGGPQENGNDFNIATNQLNFLNGLATGGVSELVAGDKLRIIYSY